MSRLDGKVIVDTSEALPEEQMAGFRGDGTALYMCSADQRITEGTGNALSVWVRANKANTISKG